MHGVYGVNLRVHRHQCTGKSVYREYLFSCVPQVPSAEGPWCLSKGNLSAEGPWCSSKGNRVVADPEGAAGRGQATQALAGRPSRQCMLASSSRNLQLADSASATNMQTAKVYGWPDDADCFKTYTVVGCVFPLSSSDRCSNPTGSSARL